MDYLAHHGIKGQKWGIRRYQNSDGSYTTAGKERYRYPDKKMSSAEKYITRKMDKSAAKSDKYETMAENRKAKTGKDSGLIQSYLRNQGEKHLNRLLAGGDLLKSYRTMSMNDQRTIDKGESFFNIIPDRFMMDTIKAKSVYDKYVSDEVPKDAKERRDYMNKYNRSVKYY